MKKQILLALLLCGASIAQASSSDPCNVPCTVIPQIDECCACKVSSHTFFSNRPVFQIATPEYETLFRERMLARKDGRGGIVQAVPFYSKSSNDSSRLATFFTPFCKSTLDVEEQEPSFPNTTDILAQYFGIATVNGTFHSKIQFKPRHTEAGVGLSYKQALYTFQDDRDLWILFTGPITNVTTSMGFHEQVLNNGGGILNQGCGVNMSPNGDVVDLAVGNMTQAFRQKQWHYGKIDCRCKMTETALANLDIVLGYDLVRRGEECYFEGFFGLSIPTGNHVKSECLFEPIVGFNHHFGFQVGSNLGLELWAGKKEHQRLTFNMAMRGVFFLDNCQKRLVDLKYKPWSRFMWTFKNILQAQQAANTSDSCLHTPGVDVFALDVRVHPYIQRTYNTALTYTNRKFQGEVGYNFFARAAECVELKEPWKQGPALKARTLVAGFGGTDSVQMINNDFGGVNAQTVANYNLSLIKQSDLDLTSAAHPAIIVHTLYGSLGWTFDDRDFPPFFGFGGSYEFGDDDNAVMNRFTLWGKVGLSF